MAAKATSTSQIVIPALDLRRFDVKIIGESPLLVHAWDPKVLREMLDKQMGVVKSKKKDPKDPISDYIGSLYWLEGRPTENTEEAFLQAVDNGARFGFPATAFKAAAVSAGYRSGITKDKVSMQGAFHILGEMVEIHGVPEMHEATVRVGMGTADIRYRGIFHDWSAILNIQYNAGAISPEQIVNLINLGGFACGIGEWRVEKGGMNGRYRVATEE